MLKGFINNETHHSTYKHLLLANIIICVVPVKLLRKSINGHYGFERILGEFLSSLDTDDTVNGL